MTVYSPPIDRFPFWAVDEQMETGFGIEAMQLRRNIEESLKHYLMPRLEQLVFPISNVFASSQSEEFPVAIESATAARRHSRVCCREWYRYLKCPLTQMERLRSIGILRRVKCFLSA